jgi:putative membrane protein
MLWFWHLPAMYDLAVRHDAVHVVEHVTLVASWTALWSIVRREVRRGRTPVALAMLATASASGNALGMLLVFTAGNWYSVHQWTERLGLSQAADQQLAGMIMWVVPGFGVIVLMGRLFLHWLQTDQPAWARNAQPHRSQRAQPT